METIQEFRTRAYMALGFAVLPFLAPFSAYSFVEGRYVMGAVTAATVALALFNSMSIKRGNGCSVPLPVFYFISVFSLGYAIATVGPMTAFWCFPVTFVAAFIAEQKSARLALIPGVLILVAVAFIYMPTMYAVRFATTYIMSCLFVDLIVTRLNALQERLAEQAHTDPLTGVSNRRHMKVALAEAVEQHRRGHYFASIVELDLDHFKQVNDTAGHAVGDQALVEVSRVIRRRLRKSDAMFRSGGEEFVLLLRSDQPGQVGSIAEEVRTQIESQEFAGGYRLTASMGVSLYDSEEEVESWLGRADRNLYEAKRRGRNRVWPPITEVLSSEETPAKVAGDNGDDESGQIAS